MRKILVLGACLLALAACRPPKYRRYASPFGDFTCEAPWGWSVHEEAQGSDFTNSTFIGPFDPDFYRGLPSLSVRWYAYNRTHYLPGGGAETYSSAQDYIHRMLEEVYGPEGFLSQGQEKVLVSGREALHFVVVSAARVAPTARFGVSVNGKGESANLRRHDYVVVPLRAGFYVLIYPATRQGYGKHLERFNKLVNSLRLLKEGPTGPWLQPRENVHIKVSNGKLRIGKDS